MNDYRFIRYWGVNLGSLGGWIDAEIGEARKAGAHPEAIYQDTGGTWHTLDSVTSTTTLRRLAAVADRTGHPDDVARCRQLIGRLVTDD